MIAKEFLTLSDAEAILAISPFIVDNSHKTGILASVMIAQFVYESTYGKSELAQKSNNVFGMKKELSGNTWENSFWDGKSYCKIMTLEMNEMGNTFSMSQDFRVYPNVEKSIEDHGIYLLSARNGQCLRYEGINETTDPKTAARILLNGGYSSFKLYDETLLKIIRIWNLQRFDRR